jgi:hypothetical protein
MAERSPELILLTACQPILGAHEVTLIYNDTRAELNTLGMIVTYDKTLVASKSYSLNVI